MPLTMPVSPTCRFDAMARLPVPHPTSRIELAGFQTRQTEDLFAEGLLATERHQPDREVIEFRLMKDQSRRFGTRIFRCGACHVILPLRSWMALIAVGEEGLGVPENNRATGRMDARHDDEFEHDDCEDGVGAPLGQATVASVAPSRPR